MNTNLIILISTIFFILIIIFFKYIKLRNDVNKLYEIGTGRKGYYNYKRHFSYLCIIYINEIDRYTNGKSKISIDHIEVIEGGKTTKKMAIEDFVSLKNTNEIDWLEGEMSIKVSRKEKLNNIKKSLKVF